MADEIQSWDMTEVEDGGDRTLLPDGRYPFTVSKLIRTRAKDGAPMAEYSTSPWTAASLGAPRSSRTSSS